MNTTGLEQCPKCGEFYGVGAFPFCTPTSGHGSGTTRINGDEVPGGGYWDNNLGKEPVFITHWSQRKQLMDAAGLQEMIRYTPTPDGAIPNPQAPSNWGAYRDMRPETLQWIADRLCTGKPAKETPNPDHELNGFVPICEDAY